MRSITAIGLLALSLSAARADAPTRSPERTGTVAKVVLATAAQKKEGFLGTVTVKDGGAEVQVQITAATKFWVSKGKVGEDGRPEDLKPGEPVSVWLLKGKDGKVRTEQFMVFR